MKSLFEQMGGTYHRVGDYLIPDLLPPKSREYQIGKYGRLRRIYLKEHRPILYTNLLTSRKLFEDLEEVDKCCNERMEYLCTAMAKQEGVTEALKADNQMEWVPRKNSIHNRAEEIVLSEIVYMYDEYPLSVIWLITGITFVFLINRPVCCLLSNLSF